MLAIFDYITSFFLRNVHEDKKYKEPSIFDMRFF